MPCARRPPDSQTQFRDRHVDLADVVGVAATVVGVVRASMKWPRSAVSHTAAMSAMSGMLHRFDPVDGEGVLVNDVVAFIEQHPEVTRVAPSLTASTWPNGRCNA